jgi:hypothetical protein
MPQSAIMTRAAPYVGSAVPDRSIRHLNQIELSRRWSVSPRTLERWRWIGQGPQYLKIGGRVVYRLDDVEAYEALQLRTPTSVASHASHA